MYATFIWESNNHKKLCYFVITRTNLTGNLKQLLKVAIQLQAILRTCLVDDNVRGAITIIGNDQLNGYLKGERCAKFLFESLPIWQHWMYVSKYIQWYQTKTDCLLCMTWLSTWTITKTTSTFKIHLLY